MSAIKNMIRDNYNMMLLREYLRREIKEAGFSHFDIQKQPTGTRVSLYVVRPGVVIGRKGAVIRALTEQLETDFDYKNPQIRVEEIARPELSPSVMCNRMASHIERGTAFRRATMWTLRQVMDAGAMGVQITVSGKLRGDRSSFEKHTSGILPRAGHHAQVIVDEDVAHVQTPMGLIGIRIRIAHKEKYKPEFSLTGQSPSSTRPVTPPPVNEKTESVDEKTESVDEKTESVDEKTESVDEKTESVDEKTESVDEKTESVDEKTESVDEKTESVDEKTESVDEIKTESEHILEEEAEMKSVITLEEEESQLK